MDSGNTAWVLVSTALVLFMTPGLAFFYGGMVRAKNVLGMLMQSFFSMGLVSVLWALVGFSLAFGDGGGWIGNLDFVGLRDLGSADAALPGYVGDFGLTVPVIVFVAYQMMFAVITPALITGATADRLRFAGYAVFLALWLLVVYAPVAHWVFSPTGWLFQRGRSTSPAARSCTSMRASPPWRWSWCWASGGAGPGRRCTRTRCR